MKRKYFIYRRVPMLRSLGRVVTISVLMVLMVGMNVSALEQDQEYSDPTVIEEETKEFSITGKAGNGNDETPGEWYAGDVPENPVPNAPVLLFVPGLNNTAQIFWEDNDMYETALEAGYQTAFIQLNDAGGESADMWDNGELLAEKIEEISVHFDNQPITIIAYSKGGVDTQTALTYYGADDYVQNVITLSSPHHGSQLADLAYSSWAGWLADLIGAKGDGTYSMQMGNMEAFRSQTDAEPLAYATPYYTLGGTSWGIVFSANWFGGTYLSQYGSNDGVVTIASSALPGGEELAIGDWSHTTIRTGETFSVFENYLMGTNHNGIKSSPWESWKDDEETSPLNSQWIYGGEILGVNEEAISISVEENVESIKLQVLTSEEVDGFQLLNSNRENVPVEMTSYKNEEGIFKGAHSYFMTIEKPESGEWNLIMEGQENTGYLLVADYDAPTKLIKSGVDYTHGESELTYQLQVDQTQVQVDSLTSRYQVTQSNNPSNKKTYHAVGDASLSQHLNVNHSGEVYNI